MKNLYRVLIVDDNSENLSFVEAAMQKEGYLTKTCKDGVEAVQAYKSWDPNLIILDVNMPNMSGFEVLEEVRKVDAPDYTSIILVTANAELKEIIKGLDSGADDYIVKPFKIRELQARIRSCFRMKKIHDELLVANLRLKEMTTKDYLTGLRNMKYTIEKMNNELENAKKDRTYISCMMFDMDDFKNVNDGYGHLIGSQLLVEVARIIESAISPIHIPARFGGDEFFIGLPKTKPKEAHDLAERIRRKIETNEFHLDNEIIRVTASFGVFGIENLNQYENLDAKKMIKTSDDALYCAKANGKNRTETGRL